MTKRTIISLVGSMILIIFTIECKEQRKGITIFEQAQKSMNGNKKPWDLCGISRTTFNFSSQRTSRFLYHPIKHPPCGNSLLYLGDLELGFSVWGNQYIKQQYKKEKEKKARTVLHIIFFFL